MPMERKRVGVAVPVSDDINFTVKNTKRDKDKHYIMIKVAIHQEEIMIINVYMPKTTASSYMKQLLMDLKGDIDSNIIIVGDLNTPLTT